MSVHLARLDAICEINPRAPKTIDDDEIVSFLPMASVSEVGQIDFEEQRPASEVKKGYSYFERGDILLAKITPCFENGKAARTSSIANPVGFGSTEFHVLRAGVEVDVSYLFHMVWNSRLRAVGGNNMTGSAGQKRLPTDFLKRLEIPLPPLGEQRRIAAILDKADSLRRKRKCTLDLLDSLNQAVFLEMFGDPTTNKRDLKSGRIGDLLAETQYGTSEKASELGALPILRMGNVTTDGKIVTDDLKYISLKDSDVDKYTVRNGDILFNRTNSADLVGKTAVFDMKEPYAFAGYLVRARTKAGVSPEYISGYLNSKHGKAILRNMAKSIVGMANINAKEMQTIPILIPNDADQKTYSETVRSTSAKRRQLLESLRIIEGLFVSLQQRAFEGRL